MNRDPSLARVSAMKGRGFYNAHSAPQGAAAALAGIPLWRAAAELLPVDSDPIVLADYGCAEGGNSLSPVTIAVDAIRRRAGPARPVLVAHADLPSNDFSSLFGLTSSSQGYGHGDPAVFPVAVGRSFFEPVLPCGCVAGGWSANAVHWLSAPPCPLREDLFCPAAPAAEREAWSKLAAADWETFLRSRAQELAAGGQLVVQSGGTDDTGRAGGEPIFAVASRALEALLADGRLRPAEGERIVLPSYYRSREEYERPLHGEPLAQLLALEAQTWATLPDPFLPALERGGSVTEFAAAWTDWLRGFTEDVFFGDPLDPDRDATDRKRLADDYYETVHALIEAAPEAASANWLVVALRFRRTDARI